MSNKIRNFAILSQIKDNKISQKREMLYEIITKIHIRGGKGGEGGGGNKNLISIVNWTLSTSALVITKYICYPSTKYMNIISSSLYYSACRSYPRGD